ncbi:hypothetical protein GGR51DRAFT_555966 [Nemania sp. FL0031]|nr:hypothetical protein GGR51DRAFT_555966 [Nemania sp. FL0031]
MDANGLKFADYTFTLSLGNTRLFVLSNDGIVNKVGIEKDKIRMEVSSASVTTSAEFYLWANMLWSFVGGTSAAGWLPSDEEN